MRLTFVAPYVPYDGIDHAGGVFLYEYLKILATDHKVSLVAPAVEVNRRALPRTDPSLQVILAAIPSVWRSALGRALAYPFDVMAGLTIGAIYLGAVRYDVGAKGLLRDADVVELHWSGCLPLVGWARKYGSHSLVTAVEYDILHQSLTRQSSDAPTRRTRVEARLSRRQVKRREPRLLNRCDAAFTFSEKDSKRLKSMGVTIPLFVHDPYIAMPDRWLGPSPEPVLLFVAAMNRPENISGAHWFLDRIWPIVKERVPRASLIIAGAHPPESIRRRQASSVTITGYIEDLGEKYRSARIAIVPVRSGSGVKFKVLQAMAYGLPVIATTVGAEGIVDRSGAKVFGAVSDDENVWIETVVRLLQDHRQAFEVGERGRKWVVATYDFPLRARRAVDVYRSLRSS